MRQSKTESKNDFYKYHPELRNGLGTWGFKGEEDNSQGSKKNRCLVIRCLPCPTDGHSDKTYLW